MDLRDLFKIEGTPRKGFLTLEWIILGYIVLTLGLILMHNGTLANQTAMVEGRLRIAASLVCMWAVYRLIPCKATMGLRVFIQLAMLGWWYPDTYELNRLLPNLDHLFATADQRLFGCQPALIFSQVAPSPIVSELLDIGYVSYYPMMAAVLLIFLFQHGAGFTRCAFILIGSFFIYYIIFDLLPVAGPTYYYKAIGTDNTLQGLFPALGTYFNNHDACLPVPGYTSGVGYWLVEIAKIAGERPTAAFPSSHAGVATVCMFLLLELRSKAALIIFLPFYVCLCLATVYIQAHYAVDAIAGLLTGTAFYYILSFTFSAIEEK